MYSATATTTTMRFISRSTRLAPSTKSFHSTRLRLAITELKMPAMSPTMTEGGITEWKVKEGDSFNAGDVLLELSTDKATIDCEAQDDGIMGKIVVPNGTSGVQVGSLIALLAEEGDDISNISVPSSSSSSSKPDPPASPNTSTPELEPVTKSSPSAPSVKATQTPSSPSPKPHSTSHAHPKHDRPLLPSVMRELALAGIEDASVVKATGFKGMLTKGDVLAYLGKIDNPFGSEKGKGKDAGEKHLAKTSGSAQKPAEAKPQKEMDAATWRQLIAVGLRTPVKPQTVITDVPKPRVPDFDSVLDQYLPLAQRSSSRTAKSSSLAQAAPKKDTFDSLLDF